MARHFRYSVCVGERRGEKSAQVRSLIEIMYRDGQIIITNGR